MECGTWISLGRRSRIDFAAGLVAGENKKMRNQARGWRKRVQGERERLEL